jgi:hypothetical protein
MAESSGTQDDLCIGGTGSDLIFKGSPECESWVD